MNTVFRISFLVLSFLIIAILNQRLLADHRNDESEDQSSSHNKLLITSSPLKQSIEGSTKQLEEYDNQVLVDAGDLLTRLPGFSAIRAGGHATDPVLRGQSQTRINIMQQGVFLHGAGPNRMDSPGSYTEPFGWDELQIIKGVESLIYGAGGSAGTLNFKRYKPFFSNGDELDVTGKLMAGYSSDYYKIGADVAVGNNSGYLRLISQHLDHKNYEDGDGNVNRTSFITTTNTLIGGYSFTENSELRLTLMANRGRDALFAGAPMDGPTTDMDAAQLLYIDGNEFSNDYSEYQFYQNKAHHEMDNYSLREQTAAMRMQVDSYSKTTGAKWQKRWQSKNIIWHAGADWQKIERNADRFVGMMGIPTMLQSRLWPDNKLDIKGVALEAEYLFDSNKRLKSGLRYDQVKAQLNQSAPDNNLGLYQTYYANVDTNAEENNVSAFSRYYQQSKGTLYWLGISSSVRTADATERYIGAKNNNPMMRWLGNPNIVPERHNQLELGAKWQLSNGWHELSVYSDQVSDFILRDRARGQVGILQNDMATIYRNVDGSLQGFEWELNTGFAETWNFYTNVAYVKGKDSDTNQPLYQIPPVEGIFQFSQQLDRMSYWFDIKWALSQSDVDDNIMTGSALDAGESDGWTSIDFKLRYEFDNSLFENNWQLSFGVSNLLDETYAYHVSRANIDPFSPEAIRVNEPGRQIWVSILTVL